MHRIAVVLALALALPACKSSREPVTTPPIAEPAPRGAGPEVTPLTKADIASVEEGFAGGRALVQRARALREAGEKIEREQSREAANDTFLQARRLYRKAAQSVEHWIEPELGVFTEGQVDGYLGDYTREFGTWIKESAMIGKVHD